ncbi:MAG TPA: threonine/serine dehydratase [Thermomicrobiales bacterium]|nr:threonine/serine dehydratase [Thermomicrobiales bacterium]
MIAVADIRAARERIAGRVHHTPLLTSQTLGQQIGARAWLKAENLQKTGAFKVRGALNAILQLSEEERARGIITVSAGNHAQGVAWAAAAVGVPATVVMAENATPSKVAATRGYGAEVVQHGTSSLDLFGKMEELRAARGLTLVHPFDADAIIAGQGTLGLEVLDDLPEFGEEGDTIVVPVGGGGLIGGVAVAIKESRPAARVIGVEPVGAPGMYNSLQAGYAVHLDRIETIADGLTAPFAGERNFDIVRRYVEDIVLLDDETILEGMRFLLARAKLLAEPAGAAATAALLAGKVTVAPGARVVAVVSGGNIDLPRLKALL